LLRQQGGWSEGVVKDYEEEMRNYAGMKVKMSFEMATEMFGQKSD
jgi:hypothetical protein